VKVERALTIFLNSRIYGDTINDHPNIRARLPAQPNMLKADDVVTGVDYDEELSVVVVRTKRKTIREEAQEKVQTSVSPRHRVRRLDGGVGERHDAARRVAHVVALYR